MPAAPIPLPFQLVEGRTFAFDPPILKVRSNEWTFRHASWSDVLVRNAAGLELGIPRRFLGECSALHSRVVVIGLRQQLEFREGAVWPRHQRVLQMPAPVCGSASVPGGAPADRPAPESRAPAQVIGIRLEPRNEPRVGRLAGGAVALGVLGCLAVTGYSLYGGEARRRAIFTSLDHTYLSLSYLDDSTQVIRALGVPEAERWITTPKGSRLRLLDYPERGFRAVLLAEPAGQRYIGSIDPRGRILQAVLMRPGLTSDSILRSLEEL